MITTSDEINNRTRKAVDQQEQAAALCIEIQILYLYFITQKPNI